MTIRYLAAPPSGAVPLQVAAVYAQLRRDFGLAADPFRVHAPAPPLLAAAWEVLRATVLGGAVPRQVKETVAAAISQLNRCPYCVDVHTSLLHAAGGRAAAWSLRRRGREAIADPALRAAAGWAAASRSPGDAVLASPPFDPGTAPEMIGTAAAFHYINRIATVFLGETPFPFPLRGRLLATGGVLVTSRLFAPFVRRRPAPMASEASLSRTALPADLGWARPRPEIATAFASLAAAVEDEAAGLLGEGAAPVRARIAAWDGQDPPLGDAWMRETVAAAPRAVQPAARLALLAALAPHRVAAADVAAFRDVAPGDRVLVAVIAWAAFTAARRIAAWLDPACAAGSVARERVGVAD